VATMTFRTMLTDFAQSSSTLYPTVNAVFHSCFVKIDDYNDTKLASVGFYSNVYRKYFRCKLINYQLVLGTKKMIHACVIYA